jgi:flagellar biosynthesis protein FlhF
MRLKSFQAKSMSEAMRQVKAALGEDAIIVSTKESPGGLVRITAAIEQVNPEPENILRALRKEEQEFDEDSVLEMVTDTMLRHRIPAAVGDKIIAAAGVAYAGEPRKTLAVALGRVFEFKDLHGKKKRPLVLVGPPGAGKTLMTAKLAAESVLNGVRPAVITTDIARAGGIEQLQAFLDILSLPLATAEDAKTLKAEIEKAHKAPQIIIDTGGLNPFDPQEMKGLARLLGAADTEAALVLPAGTDAEESAEIAQTFAVLGVRKIIPTRLDFARRMGGILCAADRGELAFTAGSHTPQVANGILALGPDALANLLMPHAAKPDKRKGKA